MASAPLDRLGLLLVGRSGVASTQVRDALAAIGLNMRPALTLMHLADGPISQQSLIDLLGVDPSALVAALNELEGLGLASRQRDAVDRRRHVVTMTADGANTLRTVEEVLDKTDDELFAALSPAERDQLQQLLLKAAAGGGCSPQ